MGVGVPSGMASGGGGTMGPMMGSNPPMQMSGGQPPPMNNGPMTPMPGGGQPMQPGPSQMGNVMGGWAGQFPQLNQMMPLIQQMFQQGQGMQGGGGQPSMNYGQPGANMQAAMGGQQGLGQISPIVMQMLGLG